MTTGRFDHWDVPYDDSEADRTLGRYEVFKLCRNRISDLHWEYSLWRAAPSLAESQLTYVLGLELDRAYGKLVGLMNEKKENHEDSPLYWLAGYCMALKRMCCDCALPHTRPSDIIVVADRNETLQFCEAVHRYCEAGFVTPKSDEPPTIPLNVELRSRVFKRWLQFMNEEAFERRIFDDEVPTFGLDTSGWCTEEGSQ